MRPCKEAAPKLQFLRRGKQLLFAARSYELEHLPAHLIHTNVRFEWAMDTVISRSFGGQVCAF